jgi:hypothetical protein
LPYAAKHIVKDYLSNISVSAKNKTEINSIIDFMMNGQSLDVFELLNNIELVDGRRCQDLRTHHYKLAKIIGYNGPN